MWTMWCNWSGRATWRSAWTMCSTRELEEYFDKMRHTFPPGLGYELGLRMVAPEQLEEIVQTLLDWGYANKDVEALLGGNLMGLARTVWLGERGSATA